MDLSAMEKSATEFFKDEILQRGDFSQDIDLKGTVLVPLVLLEVFEVYPVNQGEPASADRSVHPSWCHFLDLNNPRLSFDEQRDVTLQATSFLQHYSVFFKSYTILLIEWSNGIGKQVLNFFVYCLKICLCQIGRDGSLMRQNFF